MLCVHPNGQALGGTPLAPRSKGGGAARHSTCAAHAAPQRGRNGHCLGQRPGGPIDGDQDLTPEQPRLLASAASCCVVLGGARMGTECMQGAPWHMGAGRGSWFCRKVCL